MIVSARNERQPRPPRCSTPIVSVGALTRTPLLIINVESYANKSHENSEMAAGLHITEDSTSINCMASKPLPPWAKPVWLRKPR